MASQYDFGARNESADRSLGNIFKDLTSDLSTLFRSEIALLKVEIKDMVAKLGGGVGLMLGAALLAVFGVGFLFVTIVLGLVQLGVPAWVSTLIVTLLLFVIAAVLGLMGKKKFQQVQPPTQAVQNMKTDIDSIKADIARVRSK